MLTAKAKIIIDLNGFTLSNVDKYLVDIHLNCNDTANAGVFGYKSEIEFRGGTLLNNKPNAPMIALGHAGTNASYESKQFGFTFTDVTFKVASGGNGFIREWTGGGHVGNGLAVDYFFENCTFDFTAAASNALYFSFSNEYNSSSAIFKGGKIIADDFAGRTLCDMNSNDTYYFEAVDGKYLTLTQLSHVAAPNVIFKNKSGKVLSFILDKNNGLYSDYALGEPIPTKYGDIPYQYYSTEKYPFVVFDENGNFLGAFDSLLDTTNPYNNNGAVNAAKNYMSANTWDGSSYGQSPKAAFIILRRDYKFADNEAYNNLAQVQGVITVDLMGFTLSAADNRVMFSSSIKPWVVTGDSSIFPTVFSFVDGNIEIVNSPMISYEPWGTSSNIDVSGKAFDYRFDNVTFKVTGSATNIIATTSINAETPDSKAYPEISFNNCIFDIKSAAQGATLFNLGNGLTNIKYVIKGGRIVADTKTFNIFTKADATTSVLVFEKGDNGSYLELAVPTGATVPADEYFGFKLVKQGEDASIATYMFTPSVTIGIDFTPKASVTLDSNLIFNVYIPADDRLTAVKLGSDDYTNMLGEAKDGYYLVSVELAANEATKTLTLVVTLDIDGTSVNGSFTFSTVKYAEKLLAMSDTEVSTTEKTLAKDMLSYIRSAYNYFNADDKTAVSAEIDAVLNGYASTAAINTGDAKCTTNGLSGATFVLEANPAVRFYLDTYSADKFSFKVGTRALRASEAKMGNDADGDYIEFTLFAYEMTEVFSYEIADTEISGEYNLIAYYADAVEKSDTELSDIVAKFYNYCASAKAYRDYIFSLNNQ